MQKDDKNGSSVIRFILLVFLISWAIWGFGIIYTNSNFPFHISSEVFLAAGTIIPGLTALWLIFHLKGKKGILDLLKPLLMWKAGIKAYLMVFLTRIFVLILVIGIRYVLNIDLPRNNGIDILFVVGYFFYEFIGVGLGEEIGWTGYLLPRLQQRYGKFTCGLILGVIWSLWHIPLFFIAGDSHFGRSILIFSLNLTSFRIIFTYIYNISGGSLLLIAISHVMYNISTDIVPYIKDDLLAVAIIWLIVLGVWGSAGKNLTEGFR